MKRIFLSAFLTLSGNALAIIPENYEALKGCAKQEILWSKIQNSVYKELPDYRTFGFFQLVAMSFQAIAMKADHYSDFAPEHWEKYIHARSSIAKVKLVPVKQKYTGVFQGAECALLRLSLTYKPEGSRPVAPGLALKVLRDSVASANVSALVSLSGQEKDFNFFKHSMSNIVPIHNGFGQKIVHKIFSKVSSHPEELPVNDMALINTQGMRIEKVNSPRHLFFRPVSIVSDSDEHDVRMDFSKIPEGTVVYKLFAMPEKYSNFDYSIYSQEDVAKFLLESEHIADIVTTSPFVASSFGDEGIFFRHEIRKK